MSETTRKLTKFISVLLITALTLTAAVIPASARGKYGFIDYSRVKGNENARTVTLQMGDLTFNGKLQNKGLLTDDEIDALIERFIRENGYNADDLQALHDAVQLAKRLDNFTGDDYKRVMEILAKFGGLLPTGGSIVSAILNVIGGNYETVLDDTAEASDAEAWLEDWAASLDTVLMDSENRALRVMRGHALTWGCTRRTLARGLSTSCTPTGRRA